jgi:hypothetical protein
MSAVGVMGVMGVTTGVVAGIAYYFVRKQSMIEQTKDKKNDEPQPLRTLRLRGAGAKPKEMGLLQRMPDRAVIRKLL